MDQERTAPAVEELLARLAGHARLGYKRDAAEILGVSAATVSRNLSAPSKVFLRRLERAVVDAEARRSLPGADALSQRLAALDAYRASLTARDADAYDAARSSQSDALDARVLVERARAAGDEAGAIERELRRLGD